MGNEIESNLDAQSYLSEYIFQKMKRGILNWRKALTSKIYAISFFVYDQDDDPARPTLTLGYNTETHWRQSTLRASDSNEAKWNYAFWPHTKEAFFGDESDVSVRENWIHERWQAERNGGRGQELKKDQEITHEFVMVVVSVAKRLHEDGVILSKFGRPIPIIVHELEYYREVVAQTEQANPAGVAKEFTDWVYSLDPTLSTKPPSDPDRMQSVEEALSRFRTMVKGIKDNLGNKGRS